MLDHLTDWFDSLGSTAEAILNVVISLAIGIAVGLVAEKIVLVRLRRLAARTTWEWDSLVVDNLRGLLPITAVLMALYFSFPTGVLGSRGSSIHADLTAGLVILMLTIYTARVAAKVVELTTRRSVILQSNSLIKITVQIVVYLLGILVVLDKWGIDITAIVTAVGIGGLAVALALQDTLSNLFAGLQVLVTQKFRKGDFIELETGHMGYISDITWRNITIKTIHQNLIIIPNNKFSQTIVKNFNFPEGNFNVPVTVGVHYDSDLQHVEDVALATAQEVQQEVVGEITGQFRPFMWFHTFNDSSIDFNIMMQADGYRRHFELKHAFIKRLQTRFAEENIEIPFPIRNLYFRNDLSMEADPEDGPAPAEA